MPFANNARTVVTGAGGGLGRALALEAARRGGRVVVSDIRMDAAEETASLIRSRYRTDAFAVACDVSKLEEVSALSSECSRLLGGIDLVVNNAGVAVTGLIEAISIEDWNWILSINLWGVIHGCRVFVPQLRKQGRGHILNVASAAAFASMPELGAYCATKAAVAALSESLYTELSPAGIGVTVLCPTFFPTDIAKSGRGASERAALRATLLMEKAVMTADDVAKAALDGVANDSLHVVPQLDAKWLWRLRRLAPSSFYSHIGPRLNALVDKAVDRRFGARH